MASSYDQPTAGIRTLLDMQGRAYSIGHTHGRQSPDATASFHPDADNWDHNGDAKAAYDRLRSIYAAEQSGNGFEMLFEQQEKIAELEADLEEEKGKLSPATVWLLNELAQGSSYSNMRPIGIFATEHRANMWAKVATPPVVQPHAIQLQVDGALVPVRTTTVNARIAELEAELAAAKAPATVDPEFCCYSCTPLGKPALGTITPRMVSETHLVRPADRPDDGGAS